jgi:serine/threonine protein kinase
MPTKIGHFEIISELAKSPTGVVYKANDPENGQTVAMKVIQLSAFGESAAALEQALLAEAESTKVLSSSNIANVYGAGEIEGQFCAAMEYIQGNSIATMLARKEGFSIWDLLDIGRQLCSGLDHAASNNIVHYSLEPSKIMCGWDGTVKILGYGVSGVGNFVQHVAGGVPSMLPYMSPEQIQGQATDGRSNLFSLGAMFYEMVTERKAFDGEDAAALRQSILNSTPVPPLHLNPKVHPLLSDLIVKALAKDPAQRYQNGRELLDDLEKCKEARPAAKKAEAPKVPTAPAKVSATAQSKFIAPPAAARPSATSSTPAKSVVAQSAKPASRLATPKAAAAGAGVGSSEPPSFSSASSPASSAAPELAPEIDLSSAIGGTSAAAGMSAPPEMPSAYASSAVSDEPVVEAFESQVTADGPKIAIDPMMAEGGPKGVGGTSFSEISELPPLKEVYVAPPPPPPVYQPEPPATPSTTVFRGGRKGDEKPKVQTREVAEKAIKEIKNVPPKLMLYALGGAGALILLIGIGVTIYVHVLNSDDDSGAARAAAVSQAPAQHEASQPVQSVPAPAQPVEVQPAQTSEPQPVEQEVAPSRVRNSRKKAAPAPIVIPGQLAIDSTPQGAQVQVDGKTDPSWVTPFALTNLQPGQHSVTVTKPGYSASTRTVGVTAGNRATTVVHLAQLMATLIVKSEPAGANIYLDGRDVATKTPAQVSVDKGQHVVLVRLPGYLDETMNAQFILGQTFNFSPTLRPLGNIDNIKTVGKMSKLFGGKGGQPGQTTVSIRTQPKGAQIAINQHLLDKGTPVNVMLDPGNYVIDLTLTGYAPVHKIVTADKDGKVVIDEVLQPQ